MVDVTVKSEDQKEAEAEVDSFRRNLGPFVVAAEKTRMPMVFTDAAPGHPVVFVNDAFLDLSKYGRDEVLAKSFKSLLSAGIDSEATALVEAAFRGECTSDPEIRYSRKDGSAFWASVLISPVWDDAGAIVQHFISFVDLTRHREDSARCKMLIAELNHRVKNTLSTVQSIVTQALRRPAEPAVIREAIESRILALSRSHDLLTTRKGFGSWVIERGLPHELGGNVTLDYPRSGLTCLIDIPAPAEVEA